MLHQRFERELPALLEQSGECLNEMLGASFEFRFKSKELIPIQEALSAMGAGAVCCRSAFVKRASGTGGVLIPRAAARRMAHVAMFIEPPEDDSFEFAGLVDEAVSEVWNVLIGAWNRKADPDWRMSSRVAERAVEYYPGDIEFPVEAGVYPSAVMISALMEGYEFEFALFIPSRAIVGRPSEWTPRDFIRETVQPQASTASTEKPCQPAVDGVVFLDPSGCILRMIRRYCSEGLIEIQREGSAFPSSGVKAAIVIGGSSVKSLRELTTSLQLTISPARSPTL